jgi:hypothetical protein
MISLSRTFQKLSMHRWMSARWEKLLPMINLAKNKKIALIILTNRFNQEEKLKQEKV